MATRAEMARSAAERAHNAQKPRASTKKRQRKSAWTREKAHAGSKATHALEDVASGRRPSRKSTRGSSNRAKSDAAFNLTEETRKGAPTNRARKFRARASRVRGSKSP